MFCPQLHADVGLLLSEPTGEGASRWTSAGHAAVYFSRICPASPIQLRLCGPGENGSVLSNYAHLGEDQDYEWNVVPLNIFLYGVDDAEDRPLFASQRLRKELQQRFLERNLLPVCAEPPCTDNPRTRWRSMVAAPFVRGIYLFRVKTTLEQDLTLIAKFNSIPNVNHFNFFIDNCADFARGIINTYFPGAARPDHINDFGMTSPKAIAKSFSRHAQRHPELEFYIVRFGQVPGTFKQTGDCHKGTEVAFRTKKWLVPMLFRSQEFGPLAPSYMLTGRFNPERELRQRPTEHTAAIALEMDAARSDKHHALVRKLQHEDQRARADVLGTSEIWKDYAEALDTLVDLAVEKELIADRSALRRLFRELDARGTFAVDEGGAVWLELPDGIFIRHVGISASNIDAPGSDPQLAFLIMLARVDRILHSPSKNRELLPQFQQDWELLARTRARMDWADGPAVVVAAAPGPVGGTRSPQPPPQDAWH